ncbi:hypothetical protein V490_04110 [Pseudogymnoascus sp. VKM F-3557]|nr:hypothetical protein V490_04110 [Pseudogymnoascus sp. VKM F-3557]
MAARVVIGIPELLREIASHIYEPASLNQLCLVNHSFKDAFTPQLYRCLRWDQSNVQFLTDPDRRRFLFKDNNAAYIRILIITKSAVKALHSSWINENPSKGARWRHADHYYFTGLEVTWTQLNDAIIDICRHAHGLQTFASQELAIFSDTTATLSSIPSLRNISIQFHEDNDQILAIDTDATAHYLDRVGHPETHFVFSGLRRLSLLALWGDIIAWRNQILLILLASPDLEFLALSLSTDAAHPEADDETGNAGRLELSLRTEMFEWLGREYGNATGRRLQFRDTKFHYGTKVRNAITVEGWANPDGMDVVYVWNEGNGPFLKGLGAFPVEDVGPQLAESDDDEP